MPGWHEATKRLQAEGELQMVGIIEEQHPERARLFMQWRRMDWPVMVDSLNLLGVAVVPITLLIDEHGIVRHRGDLDSLETFLSSELEAPSPASPTLAVRPSPADLERAPVSSEGWRRYADALFLWGGRSRLDQAVAAYRRTLAASPGDGPAHFRLGVSHRRRYDSPHRRPDDFSRAVEHWGAALESDPNQYIWRRRIQQYGPRLIKPYPFYDWVATAREEIAARGEVPSPLRVEPGGAEVARPAERFVAAADPGPSPDPDGRITRDEKDFVEVEQTVVPATIPPGAAARIHLVFRPNLGIDVHWNNEGEDLAFWIDPPEGWRVDRRVSSVPNPPQPVSEEDRRLELEVRSPEGWTGIAVLSGYALYYVCEGVEGTCLYRRQDVELRLEVAAP